MLPELPFEWFVLLLRVLFVFFLYFFVFQVVRVISRELRAMAVAVPESGSAATPPPGSLIVDDPGETPLRLGEVIPLDPVSVIGRNRRAAVVVEGSFVSSEHAQLSWRDGRWWIADLGSTNGTFVNGARIDTPTVLANGDRIGIGGVTFRVLG
jgi:hypothetical protein